VGRVHKIIRGYKCCPLSMKISSPKAINWTLKQYGYRDLIGLSSVTTTIFCVMYFVRITMQLS
jgi:hypothetical protein